MTAVTTMPVTARGRRTRDALVSAARDVFERRGFPESRMSDIADAAGVSHGTVYTYFPSKEAVLAEVVDALLREVTVSLRVGDEAGSDPVARIDAANRRYLDTHARNARMLAVIEQVATTDGHYRRLLDDLRQGYVERAVQGIARLRDEGLADPSLDPEVAGAALCGMVESYARSRPPGGGPGDEQAVATLTLLWARAIGLRVGGSLPDGGAP